MPPLGNLLLLGHVCLACVSTVCIKTSEDNQLHEEAHTRHRPFQEMSRARGEGRVGLRSPNNQRSSGRTSSSSPSSRRGDSFLPGQGVASSAGSGDRSSRRACYLGNFIARLRNLSLKVLVMMTQKTRETKSKLQLTDQKQKRVWRVQGKGVINQVFSNHNSALSSININAPRCGWCIIVDG